MNAATIDEHFLVFASSLEATLAGHGVDPDEDFTKRQKRQVESLIAAEKAFKKTLLADSRGVAMYRAFVKFILETRRNILDARPYFRERQEIFKSEISPALRGREDKTLYKYSINWPFINFILKAGKFSPRSRVRRAADRIQEIRRELIEANIPLAISRARIFRGRTRQLHLTYMDLVQISNEGLIAAVDKFVLPYTPVFRSVIIGRAVGNLIESSSETSFHFYPSDKRKIYRANKASRDPEAIDWDRIVANINVDSDEKHKTNVEEVQKLMLAASLVSMDAPKANDEIQRVYDNYEADAETRPDVRMEKQEILSTLYSAIEEDLTVRERKAVAQKGVTVP